MARRSVGRIGLNMRRLMYILLFYTCWFTWFELCQGYGVQVLPEEFKLLYWINMGVLFFVSISLASGVRAGAALTIPVMILEDIAITTVHRAFEGGVWYALTCWNLKNHPWYGAGTAWWLNTVFGLKLTPLEGFIIINMLMVACFVIGFKRELSKMLSRLKVQWRRNDVN